ncbi:MAG: TVP38/TMEM64 family protein, partial [Alphaproteobacteria bacterium]
VLRRLVLVALLAAGLGAAFAFGLDEYLTYAALRAHRAELAQLVAARPLAAGLGYVLLYAVVVALSVPGGAVMTIAGGFLFGSLVATALTVVGATAGATAIFLIAKTVLGDPLRARAGPWLKRMEDGFRADGLNYLLVLRLVPLFPFFVVNIVPAFLGVGLRTYVIGTFFGIIPGTFVFASVGAGLGSVLESDAEFSAASVLTTEVVIALVGLAALALAPVAYRRWRRPARPPGTD